jgi:hypothetical protein
MTWYDLILPVRPGRQGEWVMRVLASTLTAEETR